MLLKDMKLKFAQKIGLRKIKFWMEVLFGHLIKERMQ